MKSSQANNLINNKEIIILLPGVASLTFAKETDQC